MDVKANTEYYENITLENQECFLLYSCANHLTRLYRSALQPIGLTFTQYLVLLALWEKAPLNISELAQVLEIEPNTVTPMVKRMEVLGLVSRSRHLFDERQVRVSVTQKGLNLRTEVMAIRTDLVSRLDMPQDDLAETRKTVRHFANRVTQAMQDVGDDGIEGGRARFTDAPGA